LMPMISSTRTLPTMWNLLNTQQKILHGKTRSG